MQIVLILIMPYIQYIEEDFENVEGLISKNTILLVTATDLETRELHKKLLPFPEFSNLLKVHKGGLTIYLGILGRYRIAHVQCSMGSISRDSSILTVSEALRNIQSKVVIMPGIAFGINPEKQNIGDVLLAEAVQPYNNKRVGSEEVIQRAYAIPSSKLLLNRFKNLRSWEFLLEGNVKSTLIPSLLLSGEELIDNEVYRDELVSRYPTASGGEMEGAGVYAACDGKVDCILIKGICDFADGLKGKNKENNQCIAIEAALSICIELFSSKTAFKELGITPIDESTITTSIVTNAYEINEVLFELYDLSKDPYYIKRNEDSTFINTMNHYCIWVYGISGCGKSNLITYNIIKSDIQYIQVNLASCIGVSIESFFNEILYDLSAKIEGVSSTIQPKSFIDCTKSILKLLESNYLSKHLVIFIEEIPIESGESYKEFAHRIYSLLVSKALIPGLENIKFILSSIQDPTTYIQSYNQKIHQQLKFIKLDNWNVNDVIKLFELINDKFKFEFDQQIKDEIISKSKRSPRFVKKFFRNLLSLNNKDIVTIKGALLETELELNYI